MPFFFWGGGFPVPSLIYSYIWFDQLFKSMGGRLPAVADMPANRTFLELSAGQSDWPEKIALFCYQKSAGDLFRFATKKSDFPYGQPLVSA